MFRNITVVLAGITLFCQIGWGQDRTSPLPELPPDVPKNADVRISLSDKTIRSGRILRFTTDGRYGRTRPKTKKL